MERWKGKVALVTGASSGIGAVIVEELVKLGLMVVGIARRKELMDILADKLKNQPGRFFSIKADITNENELLQVFAWIQVNLGHVSILVNNAASLTADKLLDGNTEKWAEVLNTNVLGLCIATREAVKDMRANKVNGHIIHINGISGHTVPKFISLGIACPTKFALTALTETLRQELNAINSKIKITSISPGLTDTDILRNINSATLLDMPMLNPKDIADAVVYVLSTPPHVQVHELMIRPIGESI